MQVRDDPDNLQLPCMNGCSRARWLRMNYDPSGLEACVHPRSGTSCPCTSTMSAYKRHVAYSGEKRRIWANGQSLVPAFPSRIAGEYRSWFITLYYGAPIDLGIARHDLCVGTHCEA